MKAAALTFAPYRVPFRARFRTARGLTTHREGFLLQLTTDAGITGHGEAAPLPEFDGTTFADCRTVLEALAPALAELPIAGLPLCLDDLAGRPVPAAVRAGLDAAALDAIGRQRGQTVAALLASSPRAVVEANATLPNASSEATLDATRRAIAAGYRTLKLKVGVGSTADDVELVRAIRNAFPDVTLRLDANSAWDEPTAARALEALAPFRIELVEQPVPAADLDGMARLRRSSAIPIAADEAVLGLEHARRAIDAGAADYLIVKPTVAGGVTVARAIDDLARAAGLATIVTSALEVGPGLAAALHAAAMLPAGGPVCGVATGALFETSLVHGLPPPGPVMPLPHAPGLGVTPTSPLPLGESRSEGVAP